MSRPESSGARQARRRVAWVGALGLLQGCAGGSSLALVPERSTVVERGEHLQVACYYPCGTVAAEALRTAEVAWERVAALLDRDPGSWTFDFPTIHLYGSLEQYQAVEALIGKGQFRDLGGFSSRDQRAAHLLVPQELPPAYLERTGLPLHYRRSVAHEAAHLATYDLALGAHWPPWLAEGMAGWVERQVIALPGDDRPVQEVNPWAATHLWRVRRLLAEGELPTVGDVLTGAPLRLSLPDAYALWTELFDFLVGGTFAAPTGELVRAVAGRRIPAERAWPTVAAVAERTFHEEGLAEADGAFRAHLLSLQPTWVETYRSLEQDPEGEGWLQHALAGFPAGALAWHAGGLGDGSGLQVDGSVRSLVEGPWEFRVALGRVRGLPLLVAVDGDGRVRLLELDPQRPDLVAELASGTLPGAPSASAATGFSVRFLPGAVGVRRSGEVQGLSLPVPEGYPDGTWGIGVAPGTTVLWEAVRASPPEAPPGTGG